MFCKFWLNRLFFAYREIWPKEKRNCKWRKQTFCVCIDFTTKCLILSKADNKNKTCQTRNMDAPSPTCCKVFLLALKIKWEQCFSVLWGNTVLGRFFEEYFDYFGIFITAESFELKVVADCFGSFEKWFGSLFPDLCFEVIFRTEVDYLISFKGQIWDGTMTR